MDAYLPPEHAKCSANPCGRRLSCLRAVAQLRGHSMRDWSLEMYWTPAGCSGFVRIGFFKRPSFSAGRRTHEAPDGLR